MATSAVPAFIDALVAQATTALPDVLVVDGDTATDDPRAVLFIGMDDPEAERANAATAQQEWPHAGHTVRDQNGEITCAALSWNGNANVKTARDAVYAIAAELENLLRADPTLGVTGVLWSGYGTREDLTQFPTEDGATALLVFTVAFMARI